MKVLSKKLIAGGITAALFAVAIASLLVRTPSVHADYNDEDTRVAIGFQIAPVPLNLKGKDRRLVGLGSYIVNAVGDCNGCHTGGGFPNFNYAAGHNPYFGQPQKTDPTVYLSGGTDFGAVGDAVFGYSGPDIISRNLTPDKTGRAEGGNTLAQFKHIIRHGTDFDNLHPTCSTVTATGHSPANCIPSTPDNPVVGSILQVMPWPTFSHMNDHDLEAIYEYLSSIPCIEGPHTPADLPPNMQYAFPVLHNDCN
ncbi:MAG: hypothetical protein JO041_09000 [Acidobacteria bacterium]|nr:hypothetical protein [Acidobacteriota bacterium]